MPTSFNASANAVMALNQSRKVKRLWSDGGDGERAAGADLVEPVGHVARRRRLQIGDHHACAFGVESFGKCLADPASGPGDDRMLPHEFHAAKRRR